MSAGAQGILAPRDAIAAGGRLDTPGPVREDGIDASGPRHLTRRDRLSHKGTHGTVAIVGGSAGELGRVGGEHEVKGAPSPTMVGAPALAARAALRAGCGLCRLIVPAEVLGPALVLCPSATGIALPTAGGRLVRGEATRVMEEALAHADAVAIGPGLGASDEAAQLVVRALQREEGVVVVDADAINAMARIPELHRDLRAAAILTPHPGEFARLAEAFRITLDPVAPATRPSAAAALAQRLGCVVVLKGAGTCVSDGHRTWVCSRGHPCMATAGTGDVLAGLLAALAAQHLASGGARDDLYDLARVGVQAHAIAGEAWATRHDASSGMLAQELCDLVPATLEAMRA
jgi:NAD(P)H-hydrate epimerase